MDPSRGDDQGDITGTACEDDCACRVGVNRRLIWQPPRLCNLGEEDADAGTMTDAAGACIDGSGAL